MRRGDERNGFSKKFETFGESLRVSQYSQRVLNDYFNFHNFFVWFILVSFALRCMYVVFSSFVTIMEDDPDLREQIFHNTVRENIVSKRLRS